MPTWAEGLWIGRVLVRAQEGQLETRPWLSHGRVAALVNGRRLVQSSTGRRRHTWLTYPTLAAVRKTSAGAADAPDRRVRRVEQRLCVLRADLRLGGVPQRDHGVLEVGEFLNCVVELARFQLRLRSVELLE